MSFKGIATFKDSLSEAAGFFRALVKPESNPVLDRTTYKHIQDIAYQGNILLFYIRGEIEKMNDLLNAEQRTAFDDICGKINGFIQFAHSAADQAAYKPLANMLHSIHSDMTAQADMLNNHGGAMRFLAGELKGLADAVMRLVRN